MPTLTYEYVYYTSGASHTRQPRVINAYGGFTPIPGLNTGGAATLQTGTSFQVPAAALPASEVISGTTYNFSFVNVSGLTQGGLTSFEHNNPPAPGTVGALPVKVLVVYLPAGGPGGKGSGAVIDAFDETLGTLVNDTFVAVSTNGSPDAALTATGNVSGYVDTTNHAETITAISHILPDDAYFDKWVNLGSPTLPPAGLNLSVAAGVTIYALAFYSHPVKSLLKDFKDFKESHKEFKEIEKYQLLDTPLKQAGKEKDGKELYEGGQVDTGDPAWFVSEVSKLNEVIARVELRLDAAIKGKAFIKEADRPAVGATIAKKA